MTLGLYVKGISNQNGHYYLPKAMFDIANPAMHNMYFHLLPKSWAVNLLFTKYLSTMPAGFFDIFKNFYCNTFEIQMILRIIR